MNLSDWRLRQDVTFVEKDNGEGLLTDLAGGVIVRINKEGSSICRRLDGSGGRDQEAPLPDDIEFLRRMQELNLIVRVD